MTMRTGQGPLTTEELEDWYAVPDDRADGTWVRGSFITTLDGRATGPGGLSGGLNEGSEADHVVFPWLREWADVVVVGAGTVRAEGYEPLEDAPMVVVTRSGDVPDRALEVGEGRGEVLVLGGRGEDVTPEEVLALAAERGWRRIVVEGGPHLFAGWLAADAVDELCLTVRPVLMGGGGPLLVPADTSLGGLHGRATHVLTWGGDVLVRTRLR